jgi:hypothetical protein
MVLVAKMCVKKPHPRVKIADHLSHFFETHILGLVTQFSDSLKEPVGKISLLEKNRCLKAMKEMLNLAQGTVSSALPQVRLSSDSSYPNADSTDLRMLTIRFGSR